MKPAVASLPQDHVARLRLPMTRRWTGPAIALPAVKRLRLRSSEKHVVKGRMFIRLSVLVFSALQGVIPES